MLKGWRHISKDDIADAIVKLELRQKEFAYEVGEYMHKKEVLIKEGYETNDRNRREWIAHQITLCEKGLFNVKRRQNELQRNIELLQRLLEIAEEEVFLQSLTQHQLNKFLKQPDDLAKYLAKVVNASKKQSAHYDDVEVLLTEAEDSIGENYRGSSFSEQDDQWLAMFELHDSEQLMHELTQAGEQASRQYEKKGGNKE